MEQIPEYYPQVRPLFTQKNNLFQIKIQQKLKFSNSHISYNAQVSSNLIVFAILSIRIWSLVTSSCARVEFLSNVIASVKPGIVVAP